jgi:hypothetical protein
MTKAEILKKSRNQIEVLKDLLLEEKESRNKLELNYKYLSDAVNSEIGKNSELQAENDRLKAENVEGIADERIIKELREELENVKRANKTMDEIILEREAEIKSLKADSVSYDDDFDKLIKENDKLKADNKRLYQEHKECRSKVVDTIG